MEETKLDKAQIVREALLLLREDGIDKVSMRNLAARLGIRAPTLYWYFPDRSAILREVIKTLLTETIKRVKACETWQDWLRQFGRSLWKTNSETPFATLLLQSAELNDEGVVDFAVTSLEKVSSQYHVDRTALIRAHSDIQAMVLGWSVFYHSHVTDRLAPLVDVDEAVMQAIDVIIANWEKHAASADQAAPETELAAVKQPAA